MATDYSKKKNAELEELLKSRSLPHTGKKAELVARLQESDLRRSSTTISTSTSSKPSEPTAKAPKNAKLVEVNPPPSSLSAVAEDEIDWEEDDSSIIPSTLAVATTAVSTVPAPKSPTKLPTPSPSSISNKSPANISTTSPAKASASSATKVSSTSPSLPPASTAPLAAALTESVASPATAPKKNTAIDPSKTRDLTVHYPQASKPATSAPPTPALSAAVVTAPAEIAPAEITETAPPSDVSKTNPVSKLGDDNTRRVNRMTRFGDGSGAYAAALAAKTNAKETDGAKPESDDGNTDIKKDNVETQAELVARKASERAKKFGVIDKPVKGLDEALPEVGLKRRRNNVEEGARGGKRFRGNDGYRRDDAFRRGGRRDGVRPAGNRGKNNSRRGGIDKGGLSEKDRLAAEARKAKFATPT